MPHWDWNAVLSVVVAIAVGVLRVAIVAPKAHDVAARLRHIADDIAAAVQVAAPNAPWADKVSAIVAKLDTILPNMDGDVLERAAVGSLARLGAPPIHITGLKPGDNGTL